MPGFLCVLRILEIAAYRTVCALLFVEYYQTFREVRKLNSMKYVRNEYYNRVAIVSALTIAT